MAMTEPINNGRFGNFGGMFVPETLIPACQELENAFREAWGSEAFRNELGGLLKDYAGRPSPITLNVRGYRRSLAIKYFLSEKISITRVRTRLIMF